MTGRKSSTLMRIGATSPFQPDHVARVERVGDARVLAEPLHDDGELALLVDRLRLGHLEHGGIEEGVAAEQALVGELEARLVGLDHEQVGGGDGSKRYVVPRGTTR